MINVLVIVNDQPYGSERPYNALRLAGSLAKRDEVQLRVFLLGDAVACAVAGQQLPDGHYHLDRVLKPLVNRAEVGCCGTCLDARGLNRSSSSTGCAARPWKSSPTGRSGPTRPSCSEPECQRSAPARRPRSTRSTSFKREATAE
jgi:uncharacterized protein involved in oxidation of intracellular sulfur